MSVARTDRLRILADQIEAHEDRFRMDVYLQDDTPYGRSMVREDELAEIAALSAGCGTAGCVGGWACMLWPEDLRAAYSAVASPGEGTASIADMGAYILGLGARRSHDLFVASYRYEEARDEYGDIDWDRYRSLSEIGAAETAGKIRELARELDAESATLLGRVRASARAAAAMLVRSLRPR